MSGPRSTWPARAAMYKVTMLSKSSLARRPSSLLPAWPGPPTALSSSSISACKVPSAEAPPSPPSSASSCAPRVGSMRESRPPPSTRRPWPLRGRVPKYQIAANRAAPATRIPIRSSQASLIVLS
jgi:hypothetical protein